MKLLVVDTETGGLDPSKHSLLQVGAVVLKSDGTLGEMFQVNITHADYVVTQEALAINKIDLSTYRGFDVFQAYTRFEQFLKDNFAEGETFMLAGNNVHFDAAFLKTWLQPWMHKMPWSHRYVDLTTLIAAANMRGNWNHSMNLAGAVERYGITNMGPHTALGDAVATAEALAKMIYE